jgi:hypothetical protein
MESDVLPYLNNVYYDLPDPETAPLNVTAGPPHILNPDLVFLFIIQGNDYLPKIKGVSMTRALQVYGKTMLLLSKKNRYLMDTKNKTFNFLALYYFMEFLKEDGDGWVQLPEHYPTPLLTLHSVLQRRRKEESIKGESKREGENTLPWEDVVYYTDEKGM